ncbi:proteoglycan 3 [Aegotheles albertisi]
MPRPPCWGPPARGPPVSALTPSPLPAPPDVPAAVARGGPQFKYAVVTKCYTYSGAQRHCRKVLGGELASVHSSSRNWELMALARTHTHRKLWIGAVTSRQEKQWVSRWEDNSPWNYANWAPAHPRHVFATCTTLSARDGLWRSRFCFELRPFICQY